MCVLMDKYCIFLKIFVLIIYSVGNLWGKGTHKNFLTLNISRFTVVIVLMSPVELGVLLNQSSLEVLVNQQLPIDTLEF